MQVKKLLPAAAGRPAPAQMVESKRDAPSFNAVNSQNTAQDNGFSNTVSGSMHVPSMQNLAAVNMGAVTPNSASPSGPKVRVSSLVSGVLSSVLSSVLTRAMGQ